MKTKSQKSEVRFFDSAKRVQALRHEAASWLGTPFREGSKAKGPTGGVDCNGLCESVMVALGACEPFTFPRVPMDYALHNARSIVLEYLRGESPDPESKRLASHLVEISPPKADDIRPGDLLCFKTGRCVHHVAIALDPRHFIHTIAGHGTIIGDLQDRFASKRLENIFRVKAGFNSSLITRH